MGKFKELNIKQMNRQDEIIQRTIYILINCIVCYIITLLFCLLSHTFAVFTAGVWGFGLLYCLYLFGIKWNHLL